MRSTDVLVRDVNGNTLGRFEIREPTIDVQGDIKAHFSEAGNIVITVATQFDEGEAE